MTQKVYEDSENGYSVHKIDATSTEDVKIIQSAIVEGTDYLNSKDIELNPISQQFGRRVREAQMSKYDFISVKNDNTKSREVTYEILDDPNVLRPLNHPTSDETLKTAVRYCNEKLSINPELVLSHTPGYHPYEYVDNGIEFIRKENSRLADSFSAYEVNIELIL